MMQRTPHEWIRLLDLAPHPEGGFFRETYRSSESIDADALPARFAGPRRLFTAIYFLLEAGNFSAFHRIGSDELWHFYAGEPVMIHMLHAADRQYQGLLLGPGDEASIRLQVLVPAGCWFAAEVIRPGGYALVGCSTAPGFDFEDFELAEREQLLRQFPGQADLIMRLTRLDNNHGEQCKTQT